MYARLSALLFLVYAIPGAWIPLFSLRLERELGFSPAQTAAAYASWPFGAVVASLIAGQLADRWFAIERCLAVCGLVVGVLMFVLAEATTAWTIIPLCVAMCLFLVPTMTLSVTYCLTHLQHPEMQFGRVRLWGTVGWVASAFVLFFWFGQNPDVLGLTLSYADSQRLAGILALTLAVYALTLPHTPPVVRANRAGRSWLAPLEALPLLRDRNFAVFCLCFFLLHVTVPFNFQQAPLLFQDRGVPRKWIPPLLTISQWSEVAILWALPLFAERLGMRRTLLLGLMAWTAILTIMSIGWPLWLVVSALLLNGIVICCYVVRGQVFVARQAGPEIRASAQGLVMMLNGLGGLLGNFLVGIVREWVAKDFTLSFGFGAAMAGATMLLFFVGFRDQPRPIAAEASDDSQPVDAAASLSPGTTTSPT